MPDDNLSLEEQQQRLDERIKRLEAHLPSRPAVKKVAPFLSECPICGKDMEAGKVTLHGTLLGYLLFGLSYQHCWFKPAQGNPKGNVIVPWLSNRVACRCESCGFVGIKPE